jgi:hypothetical protein
MTLAFNFLKLMHLSNYLNKIKQKIKKIWRWNNTKKWSNNRFKGIFMNNINNKWWLENVLWIYSEIDELPTISFMWCRCKTEGIFHCILFNAFWHIWRSTTMQSLYHCPSFPCKIIILELYMESLQYGSKCCKCGV